jgi:hypothetical protein
MAIIVKEPVFRVAKNRCVLWRSKDGKKQQRLYKANEVLPRDCFSIEECRELHASGFAARFGGEDDVPVEEQLKINDKGDLGHAPPAPPRAPGLWNVDPSKVVGKSLEELNTMVLERDPSIAPLSTAGEALAQLSADFRG